MGTAVGSLAVPVPVGVLNRNPFCEEDKLTGTAGFLKKDQSHCLVPIPVKQKAASQHQRLDNMPKKMGVCDREEKQLLTMRWTKDSTQVSATPDPLCRSSWATMTPPPSAASDCRILPYTPARLIPLNSQRLPALTAPPVSQHSFSISEGRVDPHASDFCAFKQSFSLCRAAVLEAVWQLERLLRQFAVPHAQVCGERLVALVQSGKLHRGRPDCLLSVLENKKEVLELINRPGQRYRGEGGERAAAVRIQACWRRHRARSVYLRQNKRKWAARTIGIFCWLHIQRRRVRKSLRATRLRHLENFHSRAEWLAANWNHIINSKRTIIHMPSLGYSQQQRSHIRRFDVLQNTQIARLCDVIDRNVEVIYVCPVRLGEDLIHYYTQLLGLHGAVETGKCTDFSSSCAKRFTVLTPEAHQHFPNHSMCVSTLLKYSPHTLRRIKTLIQGKHAYIVGGVPHMDDLAVADELGVPVLGPEPAVAQLYGTKSGARRIFSSAGVSTPPGHADIYTLQQLHECLSQLITDHLEVQRWLFKTDGGLCGCDIAYFDVCHVSFMPWALQEYRRHGPQLWRTAWAQERVLLKFQEALPALLTSYAKPFDRSYPNWTCFLKEFLRAGGVIEAYPPSDSVTSLTVDLLVEPGADVRILSCGDQLHGPGSLHVLGCTVPQSSVCPDVLHSVCMSVGKACRERNILGHLCLDLVTFLEPGSLEQQVWAVDLDLGFSNQLAMTQLMLLMTGGTLNCHASSLQVPCPIRTTKPSALQEASTANTPASTTSRFAVMSNQLFHTHLSMIHYNVFFKICKAQGIGFDIKEKQGSVFTLHDGTERNSLGMVTISQDLQGALLTFARNLFVIHQEISAPNMQGETNFKGLIKYIEEVLDVTIQNTTKEHKEDDKCAEALLS